MLTNEQGLIGGAPSADAGAAENYTAIVDQPYQFDFYDGGGLDLAFLSFAEVDAQGNVNVSRFAAASSASAGSSTSARTRRRSCSAAPSPPAVWTSSGRTGETRIRREGKFHKFNAKLEQVSYSGPFAEERGQEALYVTERAVFRRGPEGIELIEIAPGVDLERDVLAQMDFRPRISDNLKEMDRRSLPRQADGAGGGPGG